MKRIGLGAAGILFAVAGIAAAVYFSKYEEWVTIPNARASLVGNLRDPSSAQFRNERLTPRGTLCGEINAKNGMGGYIGFRKYIAYGVGANYIEKDGVLGEWSGQDFIEKLEKKTEILKLHNKWVEEGVAVPKYSESEIEELARERLFDDKWRGLCEST